MATKQYDSFVADENDPSWGTATTTEGQDVTTSADDANENMAPPLTPMELGQDPATAMTPEELAAQGAQYGGPMAASPPGSVAAGAPPAPPAEEPITDPMTGQVIGQAPQAPPLGVSPNPLDPAQGTPYSGGSAAPPPPDVAPSAAAGGAPGSTEIDTNQYAEDPEARAARATTAGDAYAAAAGAEATGRQNQDLTVARTTEQEQAKRQRELQDQQDFIQTHIDEQQKAIDAIEAHPIDENAFWNDHPGRTAAAWIGLALSGFLQGASNGANPAMNQFMGALQHAQDRNIQLQKEQKESALNQRAKQLGHYQTALDSVRMQLGPVIQRRIESAARAQGLQQLPPAATSIIAKIGVQTADAKNKIGAQIEQTTKQKWEDAKATGVPPQLQSIGVDRKGMEHVMNPKGEDLGGKVDTAVRLKEIRDELGKMQSGNALPGQNILGWGAATAPLGARLGSEGAQQTQRTNQLLAEASKVIREGNVRLWDNVKEAADFEKLLGKGDATSVLTGLDSLITKANHGALAAATSVTDSPQQLVDYIRQRATGSPGPRENGGAPPAPGAPGGLKLRPVRPAPAPAPGGGAQPPLAPPPPGGSMTSQPASATGTPTATEEPVKLSTLHSIKTQADAAGVNGDALTKIIRFESGGRPDAKNAQSGATGLIQWMPEVFKAMGKPAGYENVRHEDLKDLSAEEQVPLVLQYFKEKGLPPNADVGDMYLAVAAPGYLGKPDSTVAYAKGSKAWEQNPSWRSAGDGDVTVGSIKALARKF